MSEEVKEKVEKPEFKFQLSENYAIDTDPRNLILLEKYEKRSGKGKHAPLSGEIGFKQIGYFQTFDRIADVLVDMHVFDSGDEQIETLYEMADRVKTLKKEMSKFLNEKITVKME